MLIVAKGFITVNDDKEINAIAEIAKDTENSFELSEGSVIVGLENPVDLGEALLKEGLIDESDAEDFPFVEDVEFHLD